MHLWPGLGHTLTSLKVPARGQGDEIAGISLTLCSQMDPADALRRLPLNGAWWQKERGGWAGRRVAPRAPLLQAITWEEELRAGQEAVGPRLIVLDRASLIRLWFIPGASFQ